MQKAMLDDKEKVVVAREQKGATLRLRNELETREVHKIGNAVWVPLLGIRGQGRLPVHAVPRDFPAMSAAATLQKGLGMFLTNKCRLQRV